jgi:predicted XRE-type DNA-binding protein
VKVERGSANVYSDLGFADPDRMLVKAELTAAIASIIAKRGLGQGSAAELLGLTQPKLSNLLRGRFRGFSERRLMDCLTRLGRDVQIVVTEKSRSRPYGRLSVVVATRDVRHLKGLVPKPAKRVGVEAMNRAAGRAGSRR